MSKYVFFGSPEFALGVLERLVEAGIPPAAIVCNPDKPVGRKKILTAPLVKQFVLAKKLTIDVLQPERLLPLAETLKSYAADFFVVAAYAKIIPDAILQIPRLGTLGVHPSLLPKYRGASPIQSVLLAGEAETGVCLYQMDKDMDHGPVLATEAIAIPDNASYESLRDLLARCGGDLLVRILPEFAAGKLKAKEQDHASATFTKKFSTEDGKVSMSDNGEAIYRKVKALNPDPGVYTLDFPGREGKRVKILDGKLADGKFIATVIQPDGKKPIRL